MSVLANQTNINNDLYFFVRIDAKAMFTSSIVANTVTADKIVGNSALVSSIGASTAIITGDLTALNVTATDTLTSYFTNTQYLTSFQGANIQGLTIAEQIQGTNLVQFPLATLSSICTTSITLDGNTLDTAGSGIGASLLLNGQPVATTSTLASSILTWSYYPALCNVDMNAFGIGGAATVQGDTAVFYDGNFENQIAVPTVFATTLNSQQTNANQISTSALVANSLRANTLQTSTITNALTLTSQQIDVTTLNATNITTATLTTITGGTVSGANGTFQNLNVTNSANFSGARPNFTTGINSSGPNNFNNTSLDNCPVINTQGNTNMTIQSGLGMDLLSPSRIQLICDGGANVAGFSPVNIIGRGGNRGQVNITGDPGFISVGAQIQGEVNITANGGGSLTAYATGGVVNITANTGSSPILGTLTYSAIKLNAAGITSYAGFASPFVAVPGYNIIQGSLGINLVAGAISVLPNIPGTIYLYGITGVAQTTGGVRCQNGIGVDFIVPYPQGFNTQPYDLIISGNPAGQKVTLSNVRILQSDGGTASGFGSISGTNVTAQNFILSKTSGADGNLLGLSGGEQIINFSNVSTLNVRAGLGTFATLVSQQVSTQSILISTINGLPFSAIVAPTIPSTFTDLTTNLLQANFISTNNLNAFTIANVSSINGFSIAQLVSSVSPQAPAPSTFLQLFTSSFVANTIQATNISSVSLQSQNISGVSTINGFTIADFVSSVSPQAPAPSTFLQLFTSSFVANTITGSSFSPGLKLLGNGVSIQPTLDNSITLTTTGVGQVTLVSQEDIQFFSPSTMIFGDLRPTTINGLPPVTSIPTNYPQLTVSSLVGSNISTTVLNAGQVLLNGIALGPQVSSFNTLQANNLSTGIIIISSINGFNINDLVNQPVISTFSNIYVSDAGILNQTSLVINVSSINGFNTNQFLSTAGDLQLVSTFNQFFTSSLGANTVSTTTLNASNINATSVVSGTATLSSINGFNINQLVNPALSTVSTFQQLFTSSFVASNIQATNISTVSFQGQSLTGISTINGFTIADFVSSVSPQPPIPSTVNQFFTSSLAVNGITNYQFPFLDISAPGIITLESQTGVNIIGDQCNVSISSSNIIENALANYTNNTGGNWNVTAGCNISINSSNTLLIYNTNTAPAVSPNDLYILGQGNTSIGGQIDTNITAANNILVNAGQSATFQGNFVVINSPQEIQLVGTQQLRGSASNIAIQVPSGQSAIYLSQSNGIELVTNQSMTQTALNSIGISSATVNLSGAVNINGAPYAPGLSSFDTLFVNTLSNTSGLLNVRGTNILFSSFTTQIGAVNNIELQANNEIFLQPSNSLQVDTSNVVMNANLSVSKNLNAPAITGLSSINGLPYTPGGGTTVSTFTQVNTNILSNNPAIGNDLLLRAANAIVMTTPGFTSISLGDTLEIQGSAGATNVYTQNFTSLNNLIQFTGSNMNLTGQSNITATSLSSINLYSPVLLWNDAPIGGGGGTTVSTFQQLFTSSFQTNTINGAAYPPPQSDQLSTFQQLFTSSFQTNTINGAAYPPVQTQVSTFTQLNTNILSNNPAIGNDLLLRAANAIVMTTPGAVAISLGETLEIQGSAGATNIYTQNFTSLNNLIQFTTSNMNLTGQSNITATSLSSINLYSPTLLWNDAPIVRNPTQFSSLTGLGAFPSIVYSTGQDLYIGVSDDPIGNQLIMDNDGVEIISGQELRLGGRSYARLDAGGDLGSFMDIVALASININAPIINLQSVSTICSGDIRASTFNGAPLPSGGGGNVASTFTTLFTTTLSNNPVNPNLTIDCAGELTFETIDASINAQSNITLYTLNTDIDIQAGNSINLVTFNSNIFIYATTETIPPPTDVLGVYIRAESNIVIVADDKLQIAAPSSININTSTLNIFSPSTICSGDIRAATFNGAPLPSGSTWVGTATSDLNMNGYTITTASTSNLVFSNSGVTKFFTSNVYRQLYPGTEIIQPVIQRGFVSAARAATGSNTVSMPFSYYDTNYTVQITGAMNGADINTTYQPLFYVQIDSGTDFTVHWTNGSPDNDVPFFWTTFGVYDVPT